ncbi:RNA polymerase sigma factor SigM [Micromonospora sp. WMMA1923]|uniref:RNA polymerase sigma factor SigM n=1 Tax=Micromonospora sp. WMMA1923 TaxID=3404125 RepID=UPI003B934978
MAGGERTSGPATNVTGPVTTGPPPVQAPAVPEVSDLDLLHAHVAGDRHAFTELFQRHRDRLWAVAVRTAGDREEAADALQDAMLSAHRAAAGFRGDSAVTTWLHRIVVNACLDRIRRRKAHPTVPLPDGFRPDEDGRVTGGVEPVAPAPDHDTALVVRQALAELPVEQRAALVLVDVQGYPVAEVARILGVAEGTVKSRCARGRARLAVRLGHLRPTSGGARQTAESARETADSGRPTSGSDRPTSGSGATTGPVGVPPVTPGNRRAVDGVGSASGRSRRDPMREES